MINPYLCFAGGYLVALVLFIFRWSELYPKLSASLVFFLTSMIALCVYMGYRWSRKQRTVFQPVIHNVKSTVYITLFIYFLWALEFIYAGGIPILKILLKQPYNYTLFGIPTLHVFVVTFSSFYTIFLFHAYRSRRDPLVLSLFILNLLAAIIIYNRGMLFFNLSSVTMIYLAERRKISLMQLSVGAAGIVLLFFVFGVSGSLRVSRIANKPYTNENFLYLGQATESFRTSVIPKEFFWSYFYISSPIANLQENVTHHPVKDINLNALTKWINNEVLMDFISKRVNTIFNMETETDVRIHENFNAATIFSKSYSYLGFTGLIAMGIVVVMLPLIFLKVLPTESRFFLTALSILCTMYLFMMFDNTIRFTGLSFQLVYPLLLHYGSGRLPWLEKIFVNKKVTSA
jgi:hypothetical protein